MDASPQYIGRMVPSTTMTAEELLHLNLPNKRTELVRGRLVVREPAGYEHGRIAVRLTVEIDAFVRPRALGPVLAAETGFKLETDPDTVRAPDVGFVSREREPTDTRGFPAMAPGRSEEYTRALQTQSFFTYSVL